MEEVPMKMYRNLEDALVEEDSPRKPKSASSSASLNFKTNIMSKYYEELNNYDPFGHENQSEIDEAQGVVL